MLAAAKAAFLPEFLNRIDEIVTFDAARRRRRSSGSRRRWSRRVADRLRDRARDRARGRRRRSSPGWPRDGFDEAYGARPLQRHVRRTLEKALTRAILDGRLADGDRVRAGVGPDGEVALAVEAAAVPVALPRAA